MTGGKLLAPARGERCWKTLPSQWPPFYRPSLVWTDFITAHWRRERILLVGGLTSQQQASVSQGRICSDNLTCCHTEIEVANQTFYLTQAQYTDTGPTSPSADPITLGAWQGSHWSANFKVTGINRPPTSRRKRDSNPGSSTLKAYALPLGQRGGPRRGIGLKVYMSQI